MAIRQSYKNDDDTDNRLNPAQLRDREKDTIPGYDRQNDGLDDHPISAGDASGQSGDLNGSASKNIDAARDAEENSSWKTNVSGRGVYGNNAFTRGRKLSRANVQAILKKKGPLGLIVTIFLGGSIGLGSLFGGALAPLAFMENVTDDLNDQLAAMDVRSGFMLRNKVSTTNVKESVKGCTKLSIRCKFKTMSAKQVARYERAGIIVTGEKSIGLGNRIAPTNFNFRGQDMAAQDFANKLKTDNNLRIAYKRALNMKFLGLNDNSFVKRTLSKFGISKRAPELKGSHKDRVNALMNKAGTTNVGDIKIVPAVDDKGNPITGPNGEPKFHLANDRSVPKTVYSEADKIKMEQSVAKIAASKPPSRLGSNLLKGLSILGYWDLACTVKNMIGAASVAAKLANQYELAKYAMPVLSLVSKMKAGEISMEDGQVIGEFFGATDSRKQIVDVEHSVTADPTSGAITPNAEPKMIDNPDYGKNVMDSPLYKLSSSGQFNSTSLTESQYSLGMGQNALLSGFSGFADILNTLGSLGNNCDFVQNWAVRGIGIVVGIVGAIFTGGGLTAAQAATSGGLVVASIVLESVINNALSGSVLSEGMQDAPMDRAAAQWSGTASILGESAKNRGMIPGNTEQIMVYNDLQIKSKNDYIAVARQESGPFDIKNQYSFLGVLGRSILPYTSGSNNIGSILGNTFSMTANSFAKLFTPLSTYAATIDSSRFKQCDDTAYKNLKINPDVQCNVRYIMPTSDLNLDTDAVASYMETNGYVETDTTTGLPPGYIPLKPQESQGFAMDMLNGVVNSFYDSRNYGDTDKGKEYGKFLDYCAYRIMPFGETYQEHGQANGVDPGWLDGSKCLDTNSEMISNFRIYTLDKTLSEAEDEDAIVVPTSAGAPTTGAPVPGENSGAIGADGWAFPTTAGAPLKQGFHPEHLALDIGSDPSDPNVPIYAMRDGVVMSAGNIPSPYIQPCNPNNTIQQTVVIKHEVDGQTYYSAYHHVKAGSFTVQAGSVVKAGDRIATMGNTGCSFGQHLHVELWRNSIYGGGSPIDLGQILYG
jgi:hypothetical protein